MLENGGKEEHFGNGRLFLAVSSICSVAFPLGTF